LTLRSILPFRFGRMRRAVSAGCHPCRRVGNRIIRIPGLPLPHSSRVRGACRVGCCGKFHSGAVSCSGLGHRDGNPEAIVVNTALRASIPKSALIDEVLEVRHGRVLICFASACSTRSSASLLCLACRAMEGGGKASCVASLVGRSLHNCSSSRPVSSALCVS
jgi:hypothetical protein